LTGTFRHWLKFNAVGIVGIFVQLAALTLLASGLKLNYLLSTFLAVESAVLHNFIWHERWTWIDRIRASSVIDRLVRFHLANGLISIVGNLFLMWLFVSQLHMHYFVANLIAIASCSVVNFLASDRLVFR
jgi:putative flippase GtrA